MTTLLEVRNIIKQYPEVTAVNEVSFYIDVGICFGLLGPNGAGKTTTVEMLEGVLEPNGGEIFAGGGSGPSAVSIVSVRYLSACRKRPRYRLRQSW